MFEPFPKLALGTWLMGGTGAPDPHNDDAHDIEVIKTSLICGITLIDTAQKYAGGKCEEIVGKSVAGYPRNNFKILTKQDDSFLNYDEVIKGCKASLSRLGLNYIDYFVCHAPNSEVNMNEFFEASNRLHQDGLVRNVGVSNFGTKMLELAVAASATPIALNQVSFGMNDSDILTSGTYDFCCKHSIPIQAFRALVDLDETNDIGQLLGEIAKKYQLTLHQMALAYLNSFDGVCFTIKASSKEHWQAIKDALEVNVESADIEALKQLHLKKRTIRPFPLFIAHILILHKRYDNISV